MPTRRRFLAENLARAGLAVYKTALSPIFYFLGVRCRHLPTCSEYSAEAVARHGAWRGSWLALSRVSRCHPFGSSGYDPVTEMLTPVGWRLWRLGDWPWTQRAAMLERQADRVHRVP